MPSQSKHEKKKGNEIASPSTKRSIRWFVHPPSFLTPSKTQQQQQQQQSSWSTSTTKRRGRITSNNETHQEKAPISGNRRTRSSSSSSSSTVNRKVKSSSSSSLSKKHPPPLLTPPQEEEGAMQDENDIMERESPIVHRLQQELEEAKEQIKALEQIKQMQEQEVVNKRRATMQDELTGLEQGMGMKTKNSWTPKTTTKTTTTTTTTTESLAVHDEKEDKPQRRVGDDIDIDIDDDDMSASSFNYAAPRHEEQQQDEEDDTTVAQHAARGAMSALLEETNHPMENDDEVKKDHHDVPTPSTAPNDEEDLEDIDRAANYSLDPTFDRVGIRAAATATTPIWRALAFETTSVGVDQNVDVDNSNMGRTRNDVPPMEVTTIRNPKDHTEQRRQQRQQKDEEQEEQEASTTGTNNFAQLLAIRLRDAELRASAYHQKLESSQDLVASLFRDLERARRTIQSLLNRNMSLFKNNKTLKVELEDHMIPRNSLIKACVYITPVFVLCGGLEFFVSTILLVWILVELEASWMAEKYDEDDDNEDEDDNEDITNEEEVLRKLENKVSLAQDAGPIPQNIVLSNDHDDNAQPPPQGSDWQR